MKAKQFAEFVRSAIELLEREEQSGLYVQACDHFVDAGIKSDKEGVGVYMSDGCVWRVSVELERDASQEGDWTAVTAAGLSLITIRACDRYEAIRLVTEELLKNPSRRDAYNAWMTGGMLFG